MNVSATLAPREGRQPPAAGAKHGPVALLLMLALVLAACAPLSQGPLKVDALPQPDLAGSWFTSFDGARLGLDIYEPVARGGGGAGPCDAGQGVDLTTDVSACLAAAEVYRAEPDVVIIAVHGMNDYAGAFQDAGAWWASQGAMVYAYDQRGFGRSPGWMIWPQHDVMRKDLMAAIGVARRKHPQAKLAVVGESMGAAMAITAFAEPGAPAVDALILSGPGLRGWGTLPWLYSSSLWLSAHVRPDWIVVPPEGVRVTTTDNVEKQRRMWFDKNVQKSNRIDSVYGVVSIMEEADQKIASLPPSIPTLLLYGAKDEVIPADGVKRATLKMPPHVRTGYYANGYHMLMNDLQARTVWADVLGFVRDTSAPLVSGAPGLPWLGQAAEKQ